jgi:hypothetical protein
MTAGNPQQSSRRKDSARQFECAVGDIEVRGTVRRSTTDSGGYDVELAIAGSKEFSFEITRVSRPKYGVPAVSRHIAPGVKHLRFTAATLVGRAVCLVLPVEEAFELGVKTCVEWYKETH